jgi:hypothetical protein
VSSWLPALVTSAISAVVAIAVSFQGARSQRHLKWLDTKLAEQSAESAAKRSYEYEARKRLYSEVNPQLFQLRESCDTAARRLRRIINGDLEIVPPKHVISSTERLFAPLVFAEELRRHLTEVDLGLDDSVRAQYMVSREFLWTFHEGMEISNVPPAIPYRIPGMRNERMQHLTVAEVQRLVDFLTVREEGTSRRPMRRNELDDINKKQLEAMVQPVSDLFDGADPVFAPVLWRLLLAQASLMHVFIQLADSSKSRITGDLMPPEIEKYQNTREAGEHFGQQVGAARRYVEQRLHRLLA